MSTVEISAKPKQRDEASEYLLALGLVDPIAQSAGKAAPAPRVADLSSARGVLLDNTKGNAGPLLRHVGDLLESQYGARPFQMARKLVYSRPADIELIDELAAEYDYVVTGVGACGSCTSGCVRDTVELEARATPTVAICTSVFMSSAAAHATAFGRPDLEFVEVEHPIAAISDDELKSRAEALVASVAAVLKGEAK
jgi:hypothetical protein